MDPTVGSFDRMSSSSVLPCSTTALVSWSRSASVDQRVNGICSRVVAAPAGASKLTTCVLYLAIGSWAATGTNPPTSAATNEAPVHVTDESFRGPPVASVKCNSRTSKDSGAGRVLGPLYDCACLHAGIRILIYGRRRG